MMGCNRKTQPPVRTMKLTVQHHYLRSSDDLDSLIENRILALQPRLQIDDANVRLECRFQESPAFSVRIHLVTPGPDVIAERRDHTIRAAIEKVMAAVETKIGCRFENRRRRIRNNIQEPALLRIGRGRR
jgi:ribosome-associated translation inhibitor RaiA